MKKVIKFYWGYFPNTLLDKIFFILLLLLTIINPITILIIPLAQALCPFKDIKYYDFWIIFHGVISSVSFIILLTEDNKEFLSLWELYSALVIAESLISAATLIIFTLLMHD